MSFTDRLILWLHIAFAIFTIGPVAVAISSTPRYIRKREIAIVRYLSRTTVIFGIGSLLVLIFGVALGQEDKAFARPWLSSSITLFIVAIVLLVLIVRDQRRAIATISDELGAAVPAQAGAAEGTSGGEAVPASTVSGTAAREGSSSGSGGTGTDRAGTPDGDSAGATAQGSAAAGAGTRTGAGTAGHLASVETGRIALMGGVVNLIWLVILVLMVWRP